jgi:hypothetical protein
MKNLKNYSFELIYSSKSALQGSDSSFIPELYNPIARDAPHYIYN